MRDLVMAACRSDPTIRRKSLELGTAWGSGGPRDAARNIAAYVRNNVTLVDEPDELLVDPTLMLEEIETRGVTHGDCDDAAMLVAALLRSIGLPVRFKAVQATPDGSFGHVFTEYLLTDEDWSRWVPLDTTIPMIPIYGTGDYIVQEV